MTIRKFIRTMALGAIVAAPLAAVPAQALAGSQFQMIVVNEGPIPMYIETLGGGTFCWTKGVPATSIPPQHSQAFELETACPTKTSQATQTVVYGVAGQPEARINFVITITPGLTGSDVRFTGPFGSSNVQLIEANFPPTVQNLVDGNGTALIRFTCPQSYCGGPLN